MPERPLLLFPTPEKADRTKRKSGFRPSTHHPSHNEQGQRLTPIFNQLQSAFDERHSEIKQTPAGVDPEQVLVIETIGNVEDFANAVKKINGLEWMGEIEIDKIDPDDDFYDEENKEKKLTGRLYLVMTNNRAIQEMLSLWRQYKDDEDMKFRRGLTKFRDVFSCLKDIHRWGVKDRIHETGIFEAWLEKLNHHEDHPVRFEIELWYRSSDKKRAEARSQLELLIKAHEGKILRECIIDDIAYHALLAEIPPYLARQISEQPEVELTKCDHVIFFRPVGQMVTGKEPMEGGLSDHEIKDLEIPEGEPVVAILDGLPMANHKLLQDRLIIDDPDGYAKEYTVEDRRHGTAMASLISHGDLNDGLPPLSRPIYVRPIMKPIEWLVHPYPEQIPDDILITDYIHRAVRRMFEGEGGSDPVAPSVKIINFSIGDPCRQFTGMLSPLARLLDWLSVKYKVLFIISAGNHLQEIKTSLSKVDFNALSVDQKEAEIVSTLYSDTRHRKLLSPGESVNGITVGALHRDSANLPQTSYAKNLYKTTFPSTFSAFGSGYRRSIKPDIAVTGGRLLHEEVIDTTNATFKPLMARVAPGNKVTSPSANLGELDKTAFCHGTSNAAALTTRMAAECHDTLLETFKEQFPQIHSDRHIASVLKAMIIHSSFWGNTEEHLKTILQKQYSTKQSQNLVSQWIGYGEPDIERVIKCTEQRATLLGFGQLEDGEADKYTLPLPPSLSGDNELRRLTITLAWLSPIVATTQRYRNANLWFEVEGVRVAKDRKGADRYAVRRGTIQHEVFEGEQAVPFSDGASLGIKVNCRKDAAKILTPITYGLAVTLEVAEGVNIAIYDEIRTRIAPAVPIRTEGEI